MHLLSDPVLAIAHHGQRDRAAERRAHVARRDVTLHRHRDRRARVANDLSAPDRIYVRSNSGRMIPITAFARQEPGMAPSQITHQNQFTTMDLSFNLAPGVSMGQAMQVIQATVGNMRMPGDIKLNMGGDFRRFQQSQSGMLWLVLAAIVTVYIVLGMLYESLIHPVTILSTLPAAG